MNELKFTKHLAKKAGKIIMNYYGKKINIIQKENLTPVTQADIKSNNYIISKIKKHFPNDGILSEEIVDNKKRLEKKRVWVIDPLDGTTHFIKNETEFSVSIALVENMRPIIGVIYKPYDDELYFAEKNKGSFLEQHKKTIRLNVTKEKKISKLRVCVSKSTAEAAVKSLIKSNPFAKFEFRGSCCYKCCLVAKGEYDVYIRDHHATPEWDICAGDLILTEAGGKLTDVNGKTIRYNHEIPTHNNGCIATNKVCHDTILKIISTQR